MKIFYSSSLLHKNIKWCQVFPPDNIFKILLLVLTLLFFLNTNSSAQNTIYVKADASGANNGSSWTDAYTSLQSALDASASGDSIWVAAGTYKPSKDKDGTSASDTSATFMMLDNVFMYGGFAGGELKRTERNLNANETILSGDLGSDTVYHVIRGADNSYLDGFIITNGYANGTVNHNGNGGGMLNDTLDNITVINCTFINNKAGEGGGMANFLCTNMLITNCIFRSDTASSGGGLGNWSTSSTISNCLFTKNYASGETLSMGGAIYNWGDSYPPINNCTIYNNFTLNSGGAVHDRGCASTLTNCILWGNGGEDKAASISAGGSIYYSCIEQAGYAGSNGNISDNPDLNDPENDVFYLTAASPCIDAGNGNFAPEFDFDGLARRDDGNVTNTGTGTPAYTDMGIYEFYPADAGITSINEPESSFHAGEHDIKVTLKDFGVSAITSADIVWKINDNAPTTYPWTGVISPGDSITSINIGSFNFEEGAHTIKAWTSAPNGETDIDNSNDTTILAVNVTDLTRFYIKADASGSNNGASWTDAFTELQSALDYANKGDSIWVAAGTYQPSKDKDGNSPGDRTLTFQLVDSVFLYGGFAGTETNFEDRDWKTNETILSGDIGTAADTSDNSYNVVRGADYAMLDGFIIMNGNANSSSVPNETNMGGGLLNKNVKYVRTLNCTFKNNTSIQGGGVGNYFCGDSIVFRFCTFLDNTAGQGGGIGNWDTKAYVTKCVFVDNLADESISVQNWGGAIYNWGSGSTSEIVNCTFLENSSSSGGAIHDRGVHCSIKNSIFLDNSPNDFYYVGSVTYNFTNQSGYTGSNGNIGGDPLLYETGEGEYELNWASPCIDAGDPDPVYNDPDASRNDMGASHTIFSPQVDALISAIDTPLQSFVYGNYDVWVTMVNLGTDPLTSAAIDWTVDGASQTTHNWTGNLAGADTTESFNIGTYSFNQGDHTIKIWTSIASDEFNGNDTLDKEIYASAHMDAGIVSLDEPDTLCSYEASTDLFVSFKNYDTDSILTNVDIGWTIDGASQTPYSWSDSVVPGDTSESFLFGSYSFSRGKHDLKIWTENPNSHSDDNNDNDTLNITIYSRAYDIGVSTLYTPTDPDTTGNQQEVNVAIENFSQDSIITSARIDWEVDGSPKDHFDWSGSLAPGETSDSIMIGKYDLPSEGTFDFKIWTEAPNGDTDDYNGNDTLFQEIIVANPLCDTFTIGASGDFLTFEKAIDSLVNGGGVCGPVVFIVETGTYNEQITIPEIYGASSERTITFQSATGDSTDVELSNTGGGYTVSLDGADYIIFKNMTISTDASGSVIEFKNEANYNRILNCQILGESGSSSLLHVSYQNNINNAFSGNRIVNGTQGISLYAGNSTITGTEIKENVFENQSEQAISLNQVNGATITGNTITSNSTIKGIYLYYCEDNFTIEKNRISLTSGGTGIYFYYGTNNTGIPDRIANNFIYINTSGSHYGIYYNSDYRDMDIIHNNINITGNATGSSTIYIPSQYPTIDIKNNILVNKAGGTAITTNQTFINKTSDFNCLYSSGTYLVNNKKTLEEHQNYTGQDMHSFSVDPQFVSDNDLHTFSPYLNNQGTPIAEITTDIDGEARDGTNPDIGADEYDPLPALSGTYNIGPSAPLFKTFNEAVDSLIAVGVDGSVTFEVQDGTYNEQLSIPEIANVSETDTIVFCSASADSSKVILTYVASGEGDNYTLKLDGADYITFKDITIEATGTEYARIVEIDNESNNNRFANNRLLGVPNKSELVYSPYSKDSSNVFTHNVFQNGKTGLYLSGGLANYLTIEHNEFLHQTDTAIYVQYFQFTEIKSNLIYSDNHITGILLSDNREYIALEKNKIYLPNGGVGLYIDACRLASDDTSVIFNNHIYINTTDADKGIFIRQFYPSRIKIYNNTIHIKGNNTLSACYDMDYGSESYYYNLYNNNFVNVARGMVMGTNRCGGDFNNFYSNGAKLSRYRETLEDWQDAYNHDHNSISVDPYFEPDSSYSILNPALNNAATPLLEITEDIDGDTRDATNPDIGADEFTPSSVPFNGTYTIAGISPDYETINDAVKDLVINGINGAVIFNIATDTLTEQISIPEIVGASVSNTITFQSATGDSSDVLITFTPINTKLNYTIRLDGADYITFKNLSISSGEDWGCAVHLKNEATNNQFLNNRFFYEGTMTGSDDYAFIYSSGTLDSNNVFDSNLFENGSIGIYMNGSAASDSIAGIQIKNNIFAEIIRRGVYLQKHKNLNISGNQFEILNSTYSFGLCITNSSGLIYNNFIQLETTNYGYGIYIHSSRFKVLYNTVKITGNSTSNSYSFYDGSSTLRETKNNIFVNLAYGRALNCDTTNLTSDYNLLYTSGNLLVQSSINYANLSAWQAATGRDIHSISREPQFLSDTDLHTTDPWISNLGTPLTEVTTDIDGETRDIFHPDIGADEYEAAILFAGEYTIGPSGDFITFTDAIDSITQVGAIGSVTFKVEAGTYNEQFVITAIPYVTDTITVTFQSASGDSTDVILEFKASGTDNYIVKLDSTKYITFKNMTFKALDSTYAKVIEFTNGAANNAFTNNQFIGINEAGPVIYSAGSQDDNILIENNLITGGNVGIYLCGENDSKRESGLRIIGNRFTDQFSSAVYLKYQHSPLLSNNLIIHDELVQYEWTGLFLSNCSGQPDSLGLISNNSIAIHAETKAAGIVFDATSYQRIYHNSLNIYGLASESRTFNQQNGGGNSIIMNNIFSNQAEGLVIYTTEPNAYSSDYNDYYANGDKFIYHGGYIPDLQTWQTTYSKDLHSYSVYPQFYTDTNLYVTQPLLNGSGTPLAEVSWDFDWKTRDPAFPDIGAYEFSDAVFDLGTDTVICRNTQIEIDAVAGYDSYLWNTGETTQTIIADSTGVDSAYYRVTVSHNSYNYSDSVKVTFVGPVVDLGADTILCDDETLNLDAGAGNYTYLWSDQSTNQILTVTQSGDYNILVTDNDNGCTASDTISVTKSTRPVVDLGADSAFCEGGSLILDAGAGGYTYLWSDQSTNQTLTVSESGDYSVVVTEPAGCSGSDTVTVTGYPLPQITLTQQGDTLKSNYPAGDTYQWYENGSIIDTATSSNFMPPYSGSFYVFVTDTNGCSNYSDTIQFVHSGIREFNNSGAIEIYPNPTTGIFTLKLSSISSPAELRIFNIQGSVVHREEITGVSNNYDKQMDLSHLPKGIYFVKIQIKNDIKLRKLIIE